MEKVWKWIPKNVHLDLPLAELTQEEAVQHGVEAEYILYNTPAPLSERPIRDNWRDVQVEVADEEPHHPLDDIEGGNPGPSQPKRAPRRA